MSNQTTRRAARYLPQVALATGAVVVAPVAVVWWLYVEGYVSSYWACFGLAVALSLVASLTGSAYWKRRRRPGDLLFSELLLWGWLRRLRAERRAAHALRLLEQADASSRRRAVRPPLADTARQLERLGAALDAQDAYTDGHSRRVALHCALIARKLGLPREEVARLRAAATLHDIGKLRIPVEVLNKPGKLTPEEFALAKCHAEEGAQIVSCLGDPRIIAMVRHHHERFDGAGYPSGLSGEETPLGARIIAVADTFDALTSVRPYRAASSHKQALALIAEVSGSQLDPTVVHAFLECYSGKRAVVFWTLLAISPERALAFVSARRPGLGVGSPTGMAAGAAAITVAAAAFVSPLGLGPASYQLGSIQQGSLLHIGAQPILPALAPKPRTAAATGPLHRAHVPRRPHRQVPSPQRAVHPVAPAPTFIPRPTAVKPVRRTTIPSHKPRRRPKPQPGHGPGRSIAPPPNPPVNSPPSPPASPPAASPTPGPKTMEDCKGGGYVRYGFTNQGQCVSSVAPNH